MVRRRSPSARASLDNAPHATEWAMRRRAALEEGRCFCASINRGGRGAWREGLRHFMLGRAPHEMIHRAEKWPSTSPIPRSMARPLGRDRGASIRSRSGSDPPHSTVSRRAQTGSSNDSPGRPELHWRGQPIATDAPCATFQASIGPLDRDHEHLCALL